MNWLTNFVKPKLSALVKRKEVPENLWNNCPKCGNMIHHKDLKENLRGCNVCNYHFRMSAEDRIKLMRYQTDKLWDGNYLDGTLLVWAEQGVGDHILFASMLTDLRKYAKNIILEIDKRLVNLCKRYYEKINFSNIKVVTLEKKLVTNFDKHIALGSL